MEVSNDQSERDLGALGTHKARSFAGVPSQPPEHLANEGPSAIRSALSPPGRR